MTENQKKLLDLLRDMFQFNQADLDFGIYRIMNLKRDEVKDFLDNKLMSQISEGIHSLVDTGNEAKIAEIKSQINSIKALSIPEADKQTTVSALEAQLAALSGSDISDVEADVYNHLINFFSRYYDEGDFISQRRYKDGVYAIPYEGEEVKLHWANADQYYVKTAEYFTDYSFKDSYGTKTVTFKIVDAETERDNNKANEKKYFCLCESKPYELNADGSVLTVYVEYRASDDCKKQDDASQNIYDYMKSQFVMNGEWAHLFVKPSAKEKSEFERHLFRYTAKNTYDYFIHKDLGKFLRQELDFYIKNEVIYLDDITVSDMAKTKEYLVKAQVIKAVAGKIIDFLAQIEDFQKKLYLKKKFVVDTQYCITLDRIPEEFYPEIIANDAQREEWVKLFSIDEIEEDQGDILSGPKVGYSVPLTLDFLKQNPFLVLDTAFFDYDFKEKLIDGIDDLDEKTNGLALQGDNYQSISFIENRYRHGVDCIHIDPPYNTDTSGFLYKNNYRHSSWMSMMIERITRSLPLLKSDSTYITHIDENEYENLFNLFKNTRLINLGTVIWDKRNPMTGGSGIALQHEYILWYSPSDLTINISADNAKSMMNKVSSLIEKYGCVNDSLREEYVQWLNSNSSFSGGDKAYRNIDDDGRIYQSVSLRAPEPRFDPKFRQPLIHPVTHKPCPVPPNGFSRTPETHAEMIKQGLIIFGEDETVQPRYKLFLSQGTKKQLTSVISDAVKGTSDLHKMGLSFPYCHSVSFYDTIMSSAIQKNGCVVLDYFAGSGTTADAVIQRNKNDSQNTKYIMCEMGEYFDSITLPRIMKTVYSDTWDEGKPVSRSGVSQAFKYLRLESYEDTLNNISFDTSTMDFLPSDMRDEYVLKYMLETESQRSLFNVESFAHPFNYAMSITRKQESKWTNVDLVETFNYLIGLVVERSYAKTSYDATFSDGEYGILKARISKGNTYTVKLVEGHTLSGDKVLVVWRDMTGDTEKDNAVLTAILERRGIDTKDKEYDRIYVNGDNNLPNLNGNTVFLIEDEMQSRMFEEN